VDALSQVCGSRGMTIAESMSAAMLIDRRNRMEGEAPSRTDPGTLTCTICENPGQIVLASVSLSISWCAR